MDNIFDFEKNKITAQEIIQRDKNILPKLMKICDRERHLEIGITYPRNHNRSNLFTVVEYEQSNEDFSVKANNACEYFHSLAKKYDQVPINKQQKYWWNDTD